MAISKAKLKGSGVKASPCFRPLWLGKLFIYMDLLYVSFKHTLISLIHFMGTINSMRILYNTALLAES
jgi:hypothetical protein